MQWKNPSAESTKPTIASKSSATTYHFRCPYSCGIVSRITFRQRSAIHAQHATASVHRASNERPRAMHHASLAMHTSPNVRANDSASRAARMIDSRIMQAALPFVSMPRIIPCKPRLRKPRSFQAVFNDGPCMGVEFKTPCRFCTLATMVSCNFGNLGKEVVST